MGGGGGGTPLFGLYGYVPLNRVWFSESWVVNMVYNFTIKYLEQGVFLDCMEAGLEAFQKKCTLFERQCI